MKLPIVAGITTCLLCLFSCQNPKPEKEILDYNSLSDQEKRAPDNALLGLRTHPKLETVLFASEPMLVNPTNMDIDARGRVWVTEGFNYRIQIHKDHPVEEKGDRIVILEDEDGDGKADTSKVFYQGMDINSALGILVLGNKVIVSCSPQVLVLTDTDGDDKADKKEIWFTGIGGEQHDHGVHAFVFGPDGKLYFNFGNSGTQLLDKDGNPVEDKSGAVIDNTGKPFRQGMVFRCNLDGSEVEVLGHNFRNNYEVAVDSYGTLWQSDNDDDGNRGVRINYVMEYGNFGYTDELTGAGWRSKRTGMHDSIPIRHWYQNDPGSIPNLLQTGAGSPTGILVYEGKLLPPEFQGQIIHADAGPNVVRSYPVQNDGAGYKASTINLLEGNKDQWFRPSDVCVAPDGSLFVADWYDPGVGGHGVGDLRKGRIFRVAPKDASYKIPKQEINSVGDGVEALNSPNMATRYLGWSYLEKAGQESETSLRKMWKSSDQVEKVRALWLLTGLPGKEEAYLNEAIEDDNPNIRIAAIRAARSRMADAKPLLKKVLSDPSAQVRREVAIALRNGNSSEAEDMWVQLALQHDGVDRWYLEALGLGASNKSDQLYKKWLSAVGDEWNSAAGRDIIWRLRDDRVVDKLTDLISDEKESWSRRLRYFRALDFHDQGVVNAALLKLIDRKHPNQEQVVMTSLSHFSSEFINKNNKVKGLLNELLASYRGTPEYLQLVGQLNLQSEMPRVFALAMENANTGLGIEAMKLLIDNDQNDLILSGLDNGNSTILIDMLGKVDSWGAVGILNDILLQKESNRTMQEKVMLALGNSRRGQRHIISVIEKGELPSGLDSVAVDVFMASGHTDLREKAGALLQSQEISEGKSFPPIMQLVKMEGDAVNGKNVFNRTCIACHQVGGQGVDFGPKLTQIGSKLAKSALFKAILDPAEAISFGYEGYDIKLKDGTEARGYISSNTENYIELTTMGGIADRYMKKDIESMQEIEGSLMTSMAMTMNEQELVDLVAYLGQLK